MLQFEKHIPNDVLCQLPMKTMWIYSEEGFYYLFCLPSMHIQKYTGSVNINTFFVRRFVVSCIPSWFWGPMVTLEDCLAAFFAADELKGKKNTFSVYESNDS